LETDGSDFLAVLIERGSLDAEKRGKQMSNVVDEYRGRENRQKGR
jgi:hypothetical protein